MYGMESKQPYGLYFLSSLLKLHAESFDVVKESPAQFLEKNTFQDATYFIVGDYTYLDNKDVSQLLNFVDSGNEIFLAVEQVPKILFDTIANILDSTNQYWLSSSSFHNNKIFHRFNTKEFFTDTLVEHRYRYESNDSIEYTWHYFFREFFCIEDSKARALTLDEENYVDYASFYIGKGKINIFLNPICLTNYFYDSWSGKQFVERVMSFVNLKHVLWDEFSKINMVKIGDSNYGRSPLNTILKFESLKWAWYLFLFTLLLLILFASKYRLKPMQRVAETESDKLGYFNTISGIFRKYQNNRAVAIYRLNFFKHFVRTKVKLSDFDLEKEYVDSLVLKTRVERAIIFNIISHGNFILRQEEISKDELDILETALNDFYNDSIIK